jgi:hypothetical protein
LALRLGSARSYRNIYHADTCGLKKTVTLTAGSDDPIVAIRNPAAHTARLERQDVAELRARILGIGCEGLITQIARIRMRAIW